MSRACCIAVLAAGLLPWLVGCGAEAPPARAAEAGPPIVTVGQPQRRTIVRRVGQPSFVDSYEQTAMYAKLPSYVQEWKVDIGDKLVKDGLMATLFVPELLEEREMKRASLDLAQEQVRQSEVLAQVAKARLDQAIAEVAAAKADLGKYQAEVDRWDSEVKRLTGLVQQNVVDKQILDESVRQLQSSTSARDAARATISASQANQVSSSADLDKANVDIAVAKAQAKVAESDLKRTEALVGYLELRAPYDGVVIARNANTGDFVLPATGDPSAMPRAPDISTDNAAPIYVVARTDVVRVFVDVPEADANLVKPGTKAVVRIEALDNREFDAKVTRTAWALNARSRTLRVEIDLPNPDASILPNMYAYGTVVIERENVLAAPMEAITYSGNQSYCWLVEDGKARKVPVETGTSDGTWIELIHKGPDNAQNWTGSEQVVLGDHTELVDGEAVQAKEQAPSQATASAPQPPPR